MAISGTWGISVEFFLTPEEQLHLFTQYMAKNPNTDLTKMNIPKFKQALREVLAEHGFSATKAQLPFEVEVKKTDYKAALYGVVNF